MTFFITNNDGSFYKEITSDANGNFQVNIPVETQSIIYGIKPNNNTHEALIKIKTEQLTNNEIISAYSKQGSKNNALKVHMGYNDDGQGNPTPPQGSQPPRTSTWKPEYLEKGAMNHTIMNKVWDEAIGQYSDETITQAMIDTIINVRTNQLDPVMNDFYKNGNTIITDNIWIVDKNGRTHFHWFKNDDAAAGYFGKIEENGQVIRATMSVNKDYWNDGTRNVARGLVQENLSAKAFYELQNADQESALDASRSPPYVTEDDKRSLEWYQIRTQMLAQDGVPEKGIWGWDIDQRVFEEAANNTYIQNFITAYATAEAQEQLAQAKSGNIKSAGIENMLVYTFSTLMPNGEITTQTFTTKNYQTATNNPEIPKPFQQEIQQFFEK